MRPALDAKAGAAVQAVGDYLTRYLSWGRSPRRRSPSTKRKRRDDFPRKSYFRGDPVMDGVAVIRALLVASGAVTRWCP
jgi:hypothetical protein